MRYGRRWGPIHPEYQPTLPMNEGQLVANYTFDEGEYITSMMMYVGGGIDGFTMETTVQAYPHILASENNKMPLATGQRLLFLSGKIHGYLNTQVSQVSVYFDIC